MSARAPIWLATLLFAAGVWSATLPASPACAQSSASAATKKHRASRAAPARMSEITVSPLAATAAANAAARQRPHREGFVAARLVYAYAPGALYELHANPGFVSTILLEPGEVLADIAAGDTARWMVTEATAESDAEARMVVLIKPQTAGLRTNVVLITDRRTYVVEAFSHGGDAYAAQISWSYPQQTAPDAPHAERLNFGYRIRTKHGQSRPRWTPLRAFDDGRRTWIEFPADIAATDMPPLFVRTDEGLELVNIRVQGRRYMLDRMFDVAELRLGARRPVVVKIERVDAPSPPTRAPSGRSR